jgi:hypothetical protein
VPEPVGLASGLLLGVILRAVQIATSIGTVDAANWISHILWVDKLGVLRAYHGSRLINHPTLGLEIAFWSWRLGKALGLHFFDVFRVLMSAADVVTALALFGIGRRVGGDKGVWFALVFFLSPASVFISAFHCNSDPLMVMFIVLALLATVKERPIAAGLLIAAAVGIKIIAFAALPLMLFGFRGWRARLRYLGAAALVGAIVFLPPFMASGWIAIRNIFGYTGWSFTWGLRFVFGTRVLTAVLLVAFFTLWSMEAWRAVRSGVVEPQRLIRTAGFPFLLVLFLGPGFAVQYMMWILPFAAFVASRNAALLLHGLVSLFLFTVYTSWAGEWPWLWANRPFHPQWVSLLGLVVWGAIGWVTVSTSRSLYCREAR